MQAWQPQYDGCFVVNKQFSWASLPFKGTFSSGPDHGKNVVVKGFSAFILAQRCQMERVRICKHVNPRKRKRSPFLHSPWEFIQRVENFLCLSNTSVPLTICLLTEGTQECGVMQFMHEHLFWHHLSKWWKKHEHIKFWNASGSWAENTSELFYYI